jgi:hypothetical protein
MPNPNILSWVCQGIRHKKLNMSAKFHSTSSSTNHFDFMGEHSTAFIQGGFMHFCGFEKNAVKVGNLLYWEMH